ncbi:MAG: hypothetical protein ABJF10_08515 [Chthoniobacter sp.]|uniref:phosphoribosyltransferase-like protein n=1 Tax=Chthoniobacter sp. TaxID=2510640 RepID=UPI0032A32B1E
MSTTSIKLEAELLRKIKVLNETAWENRVQRPLIDRWLSNFDQQTDALRDRERLHALFLLSQFIYFGSKEVRELLKSLYRDLYRYPIIERIRRDNQDTCDQAVIEIEFKKAESRTRFLGVGNPSESGCHLLYYFRQENQLPSNLFIHGHEIFTWDRDQNKQTLRHPDVDHYVFIDDLCGSGEQARIYSQGICSDIRSLNKRARISYLVLFATDASKQELRKASFDFTSAVVELDSSFRVFGNESRYFKVAPDTIDGKFAEMMSARYGQLLCYDHPLGYRDSQLLLGFHHNTPDNTLPIMWCDQPELRPWIPVFRRYPKYL